MRSLILVLIGLFVGAACALIAMSALRQGTAYPNGVMAVMSAHMQGLGANVKQNRCASTDLLPHLQTMRHLANDLEPAFLPTEDDERFVQHATVLRASLDAALATPPADCAAAGVALDRIQNGCQACHRDFKG